jgi:hypothetical protein
MVSHLEAYFHKCGQTKGIPSDGVITVLAAPCMCDKAHPLAASHVTAQAKKAVHTVCHQQHVGFAHCVLNAGCAVQLRALNSVSFAAEQFG